ncbi:unnamed protein product [Prunus armeniaca]
MNHGKHRVQYEADLKAKAKYPINNYISISRLSESHAYFVKELANISIPSSVTEALKDLKWKEAMNEEMRALQNNATWELISLPHRKKTMGCMWIYNVKLKANGSFERYKARLVAEGILLSLAANLDWPLHQSDVKNAFLHEDLEKEVYMDLPLGCSVAHDKNDQRNGEKITALITYVDDMVITENDA